jgi:hypothetical protein
MSGRTIDLDDVQVVRILGGEMLKKMLKATTIQVRIF